MTQFTISLNGGPLTPSAVESVARADARVELTEAARGFIEASHARLAAALGRGAAIYGVNTGFGSLSRQRIAADQLADVQRNLIRSHAAGVGEPLGRETVRAMLLLLAASLARGCSGVRPVVVESIVALLDAGITPVVPSIGSVGASGDLAPLAHAVLVLLGEGEAIDSTGARLPGADALKRAGIAPIELGPKEGLALINGTHLMAGEAALLLQDADRLLDAAVAAAAMSIDSVRATNAFLDPRVYDARHQAGPALVADRMARLLEGSQIVTSHAEDDPRVQDPYSFRCAPLVLGAAVDAIEYFASAVEAELGAVTDNPLILEGEDGGADVISAGCFHGMPIALPLDTLAIAIAHIGGISERRTYQMLSASDPESHLTPMLSPHPGLESGFMITQYTAAACCNELIGLANPASVANIPTCAGMEDYNSFGPRSAAKARRAIGLAEQVVAIELLCAAEAIDRHRPLRSGDGAEAAHDRVREVVAPLTHDRSPAPDIAAIVGLIRAGAFEAGL